MTVEAVLIYLKKNQLFDIVRYEIGLKINTGMHSYRLNNWNIMDFLTLTKTNLELPPVSM